jgi:SagB-type dehydrogenase family enzyme
MPRDDHDDRALAFRLFWENSTLGPRTGRGFAAQLDEDARTPRPVPQLFYPASDAPLGPPSPAASPLAALFAARRSRRAFGDRPLRRDELSALCLGLGRAAPSAGATYAVETFVLLWRADHALAGRAAYYTPDTHALSDVAPAPPFDPAAFGLEPEAGAPAAAFLFVGLPERVTSRYDERGGRFLLLEAGHRAQNLLLAAAALDLAAVPLGGTWDRPLLGALALDDTRFALTYARVVGAPQNSR